MVSDINFAVISFTLESIVTLNSLSVEFMNVGSKPRWTLDSKLVHKTAKDI